MNSALLAGVSGLKAHQTMIDVAGNNLANIDTMGYKSSRVTFGELLSQTMREASQPTALSGGTNPIQIGSGVGVVSIDRNMTQGSLVSTGQPLDMAIDGSGYFVLNDGGKDVYTRVGSFTVDSQYYLVDPATGNRVQRIGSEGVNEGFQDSSSNNIRIPYDVALPASVTQTLSYTGNLSADEDKPTTNLLTSGIQYTKDNAVCNDQSILNELDQASGMLNGVIDITGTDSQGNAVVNALAVDSSTTVGQLLNMINMSFPGSTASLINGEIRLKDNESGYSLTDLNLSYTGDGALELPNSFTYLEAGGAAAKNTNVEIFDSQGNSHVMSAAFVRTNQGNQWDMVLTSITGDVQLVDRRIQGISFLADGSFGGMNSVNGNPPDQASFKMAFGNDPTNVRDMAMNFGTVGEFNGLSQFGGTSTVAPSGQDGYASGWLSTLSVTREGTLVGVFTNGIRKDIASLKIATFQNAAGLESIGGNYFNTSANSGQAIATKALSGSAGAVKGGSLEKSNVETASEFVNLIVAQNGFQANARTITVSNDMLKELTNLIR